VPVVNSRCIGFKPIGILLALTLLLGLGAAARAADAPDASKPSVAAPAPSLVTPDKDQAGAPACPPRPPAGVDTASKVSITLDSDTLWRPRGSEVRFTISGVNLGTIAIQKIQVCMGWQRASPEQSSAPDLHNLIASPVVQSISAKVTEAVFGAIVPDLPPACYPWPFHLLSGCEVPFTAAMTVPVADMVVAVTLAGASEPSVVVLAVGVTYEKYAFVLAVLCVALFFLVARAFLAGDKTRFGGANLLLRIICTNEGYASLSQFQILLWSVTIAGSAVYSMVLSGNLINLTNGTLVLLGIAGGAALLARVTGPQPNPGSSNAPASEGGGGAAKSAGEGGVVRTEADGHQAGSEGDGGQGKTKGDGGAAKPEGKAVDARRPQWSDLVIVEGAIDATRVQMLIFTLISAAFVILKVLVSYTIPDIPENFQLLMGISNGIYVAGRQLPNQKK